MPDRCRCLRVMGGKEHMGTISWEEHLLVHAAYVAKFSGNPFYRLLSAERIALLGGFGYTAVIAFLGRPPTTWEPEPKLR
jgi:hypothetical protein